MSNAKEMWGKLGYPFFKETKFGIIYSDKQFDVDREDEFKEIYISSNGYFEAGHVPFMGNHKEPKAIDFSPEMTKALIEQLKEFQFM